MSQGGNRKGQHLADHKQPQGGASDAPRGLDDRWI
jgi:hypothetical protein